MRCCTTYYGSETHHGIIFSRCSHSLCDERNLESARNECESEVVAISPMSYETVFSTFHESSNDKIIKT